MVRSSLLLVSFFLGLTMVPWISAKCEISLTINSGVRGDCCNQCNQQQNTCPVPVAPAEPAEPANSPAPVPPPVYEDSTSYPASEPEPVPVQDTTTMYYAPPPDSQDITGPGAFVDPDKKFNVTFHSKRDFGGIKANYSGSSCQNLASKQCPIFTGPSAGPAPTPENCITPEFPLSSVQSVNTHGTCAKLFTGESCTGDFIRLGKGYRFSNTCMYELALCSVGPNNDGKWNGRVQSVGPC